MQYSYTKRTRGFSLIEVMVAMSVVLLGSISTIGLITQSKVISYSERDRARAHQIVMKEMEKVRRQLFSQVAPATEVTLWDNKTPDDPTDDTVGTLEMHMRTLGGVTLAKLPEAPQAVLVEVSLTWSPRGSMSGRKFTERLVTYIAP